MNMNVFYLNFELIALFIIGILSLRIKNREFNHKLIKIVFLVLLVINPFQLLFSMNSPNLIFEIAIVLTTEIIIVHNLIVILIKPNFNQLFQNTIILITTSLIGIVSSSNLLIMVSWFACLIFFVIISYFYTGEPKKYHDYILILLSFLISIVILLISAIIPIFSIGSANIVDISSLNLQLSIVVCVLFLFGFGALGGLFPFNLLFSRFYTDSGFQTLKIYMIIQYASIFSLFRLIFVFDIYLFQFGLILLILSALGSIISIYKTLNDFFFNFGSKKSSLRNILGNCFILDFNNIFLLSSLFFISNGFSISLFFTFVFFIYLAKFLLMVPILYKLRKIETNDLNKIGHLFQEDRFLGILTLISGFIVAFPSSALSFNLILNALNSSTIQLDSILYSIIVMVFVIHSIYILANIMLLASISVKINFNLKIIEED